MEKPPTRLFHLHYNAPDVAAAERALADEGFPLRRRFGHVAGESVALAPDEDAPDGFRFRLQTHQRGYVNLTLAPGRALRFDHLGVCTREFDSTLERAEAAGWPVHDPDGRRPFLVTPWGFRIEMHRDGGAVESSLGDWRVAHLVGVELRVSNPNAVRAGFEEVFDAVPGLTVRSGAETDGRPTAEVRRFEVDGTAFDGANGPQTVDATVVGED